MSTLMHKIRPYYIKKIYCDGKEVGFIHLVKYNYGKNAIPHLEYEIDPKYRNQGIMSRELVKYFKGLKKYEGVLSDKIIAVVKKDNQASMRILEKMNFSYFKEIENYYSYIWCSKFKIKEITEVIKSIQEAEEHNNYFQEFNARVRSA